MIRYFWIDDSSSFGGRLYRMREPHLFEIAINRHMDGFHWSIVSSLEESIYLIHPRAYELSFEDALEKLKDRPREAMMLLLEDV